MSDPKPTAYAISGWFTDEGGHARLLGTRCRGCGTYFFPREKTACKNPACGGGDLEDTELSTTGTLWSYTTAGYPPPEPFIPAHVPFRPFALAAVELEREKLCVMGMVPDGIAAASLRVGMRMELLLDTLYEDAERRYLTWKWQPAQGEGGGVK